MKVSNGLDVLLIYVDGHCWYIDVEHVYSTKVSQQEVIVYIEIMVIMWFWIMCTIILISDGFDVAWVFIVIGFLSTTLHIIPHTQVVKTCYKLQIATNKQCGRWNIHIKPFIDHELM
jgi:hypothetical protein